MSLATFAAAALLILARSRDTTTVPSRHRALDAVRAAWRLAAFRRWVIASIIAGAAIDTSSSTRSRR